ncbi:replication initiator [Nocardioides jiangsuensis]|uniref:replication initiator n=1 Tax=Nocardioides jiangsuensis TaxID=2866161 RepID=UPI0035578EBD
MDCRGERRGRRASAARRRAPAKPALNGVQRLSRVPSANIARHALGAYERLWHSLATLGYRGHPITKSRRYSINFGHLRRARPLFKSQPAALEPDADVRLVSTSTRTCPRASRWCPTSPLLGRATSTSTRRPLSSEVQLWRGPARQTPRPRR